MDFLEAMQKEMRPYIVIVYKIKDDKIQQKPLFIGFLIGFEAIL
jgi:hypothetical protein